MARPGVTNKDVVDGDFFDASELASAGATSFLTVSVVSTTSGTKTVVVGTPSDGEGIKNSKDHPVEAGDIVVLTGTSGGTGDGTFTVASVTNDTTFVVVEAIGSSTGGSADFRYSSGASKIGVADAGGLFTATTIEAALAEVKAEADTAFSSIFAAGGDLSGTTTSQSVIRLSGSAGVISVLATALTIAAATASFTLGWADKITNSGTGNLTTIKGQDETGTTSTGGGLIVRPGTGTSKYGDLTFGGPAVFGGFTQAMADTNQTINAANSANNVLITTGANTAVRAVTSSRAPTLGAVVFVQNNCTTNGITFQFATGSATATIPPGTSATVYGDGTNAVLFNPAFSAGGDLSGSATSQQVIQISNATGNLQFIKTFSTPTILQGAQTTDTATFPLLFQSQTPFASATGTNRNPGNMNFTIPAPAGAGTPGTFTFKLGASQVLSFNSSNFAIGDFSGIFSGLTTQMHGGTAVQMDTSGTTLYSITNSGRSHKTVGTTMNWSDTTGGSVALSLTPVFGGSVAWLYTETTTTATWGQTARTTDAATSTWTWTSQAPFGSATLTNRNSGSMNFVIPTPAAGGNYGTFQIKLNTTAGLFINNNNISLGDTSGPFAGVTTQIHGGVSVQIDTGATAFYSINSSKIHHVCGTRMDYSELASGATAGISITPVSSGATTVFWADSVTSATIGFQTRSTDTATVALVVQGQGPLAGATGTNRNSGAITLITQLPPSGGTTGDLNFTGNMVVGQVTKAMADADQTLTATQSRANTYITTGALTAQRALTGTSGPTLGSRKIVRNNCTGNNITFQFLTGAATAAIAPNTAVIVEGDGTNAVIIGTMT